MPVAHTTSATTPNSMSRPMHNRAIEHFCLTPIKSRNIPSHLVLAQLFLQHFSQSHLTKSARVFLYPSSDGHMEKEVSNPLFFEKQKFPLNITRFPQPHLAPINQFCPTLWAFTCLISWPDTTPIKTVQTIGAIGASTHQP